MRELKFRAWDTIAKQMAPLSNKFINLGSGYVFENVRDGLEGMDELVYSKRFILMQYTGLKDKNGVEIYEGDIIKSESSYPLEVLWYQTAWHIRWKDIDCIEQDTLTDDQGDMTIQDNVLIYMQVIGNIYQHPQLIK